MSVADHDVDFSAYNALTVEQLRARGSNKWNTYGDALALWVAEMDVPWCEPVKAAVLDAVERQETGYPRFTQPELNEAFADYAREHYGLDLDPADIVNVGDVLRALELGLELFSPEGAGVIVPTPSYPPMSILPGLQGRPLHQVPLRYDEQGHATMDLDGIARAFDEGGHTVLLTQPHNPTGRMWTREEMSALAELVDARGGRVISDEIHAPLAYCEHLPYAASCELAKKHTLTAHSAGKGWNIPGLRCALVFCHNPEDSRTLLATHPLKTNGASTLGIRATEAAYRGGEEWRLTTVAFLKSNAAWLEEKLAAELPELGWKAPESTYFAWLDMKVYGFGDRCADQILEHGLALNCGSEYGENSKGWVRLNYACPRPILEEAVVRLVGAVREQQAGQGGPGCDGAAQRAAAEVAEPIEQSEA